MPSRYNLTKIKFFFFFAASHLVCSQILDMWGPLFSEHSIADLRDEQIFRWWILHVRSSSHRHDFRAPRWPAWSYGLYISQSDQMYIPQVRSLWNHTDTWFALRTPAEHHQRKNIHIHMVLVSNVVSRIDFTSLLQVWTIQCYKL